MDYLVMGNLVVDKRQQSIEAIKLARQKAFAAD
jgi:hypothetical protein